MINLTKTVDYDDVVIVPATRSYVNSRDVVNMFSNFYGKLTGKPFLPIMSSPMREISGIDLVRACSDCRVIGILHRFESLDVRKRWVDQLSAEGKDFSVAVGMSREELDFAVYAEDKGASLICVDVANGYIKRLHEKITDLARTLDASPIMTGNVITAGGAMDLDEAGANFVRVGIGSGNLCTTRETTGVGRGQLSALSDVYESFSTATVTKPKSSCMIVSDGGINSPARAVKSFLCGADYVMIGSLFAFANEAENKNGLIYGMASRRLQNDVYGAIKSVEGREMLIDINRKRPLTEIVQEFIMGVQSACTYLNCNDYSQLRNESYSLEYVGNGTLKQL